MAASGGLLIFGYVYIFLIFLMMFVCQIGSTLCYTKKDHDLHLQRDQGALHIPSGQQADTVIKPRSNQVSRSVNRFLSSHSENIIPNPQHTSIKDQTASTVLEELKIDHEEHNIVSSTQTILNASANRTGILFHYLRKRRAIENYSASAIETSEVASTTDNISHANNLLNFKTQYKRQDGRAALVCIGAIIFLLLVLVLYTRMWKERHSGWEYLRSDMHSNELEPSQPKASLKDILHSKTRILTKQLKASAQYFKNKRHQQKLYHKLDTIGEHSQSETEDEVYSR